ncbi:MAG: universal stress protein [Cyclobacteriaceae bacterium]
MKKIRNILAPTDFSPTANNALLYATELAKEIGAKIFVLHAYRLPAIADTAFPVGNMYPESMVNVEEVKHEVERELEQLRTDYLYSRNLKYETLLEMDFAEEAIEKAAKEHDIDLIIMGSRGANALQELFGSTSTHIINKINTPVLIIPRNVRFGRIENIVLATDYHKNGKTDNFDIFLDLVNTFHANVDVLHVRHQFEKLSPEELDAGEDLDRILRKTRHSYHYNLEQGDINKGIESFLKDQQNSMLVMIARNHSLIDRLLNGSHTQHMIFKTEKPMLVLKDQ